MNRDQLQPPGEIDRGAPTVILDPKAYSKQMRLGIGGWIILSCLTVLFAVFIRSCLLQGARVSSASMRPTLDVGDYILINKMRYGFRLPGSLKPLIEFRKPKKGDVIVFRHDAVSDYIKRIAAVPGDLVQAAYGPMKLGPDEYFVMGDNLTNSEDSRSFGPIKLYDIEGQAMLVYWSWSNDGKHRVNWKRIGHPLR